jgi:SAM-dependent methyltransferase
MSERTPLPASSTKHLVALAHPLPGNPDIIFRLRQLSSVPSAGVVPASVLVDGDHQDGGLATPTPTCSTTTTGTTGTTLWLGAQVMAAYLGETLRPPQLPAHGTSPRRRALDVGAGVGYLALCLAAWGYDVVATDIEPVVSSVLRPNIDAGLNTLRLAKARSGSDVGVGIGSITVVSLDWTLFDSHSDQDKESDSSSTHPTSDLPSECKDPFDLILSTDTIYHSPLVRPLWATLRHFALSAGSKSPSPQVLIALERRDGLLVGQALASGRQMGFELKAVPGTKLSKALKAWKWARDDWDGVEVWKGKVG